MIQQEIKEVVFLAVEEDWQTTSEINTRISHLNFYKLQQVLTVLFHEGRIEHRTRGYKNHINDWRLPSAENIQGDHGEAVVASTGSLS